MLKYQRQVTLDVILTFP